ncbi:MAG: AAA family ATPase, partial [Clostridia bacterium]|nr:AAA family ATPase [Clostridia bacterium]
MILKALEMQGFKSFPDKTKFNFNAGITAVVGPNGSGKSNISDAVRWVLGEQSSKSLRGSKMEDVIFSGTSVRRAQGFAEVTLYLDNSDRESGVDSDELNVTRRYYRSGESEYLINGKTVRLRDVHEAFMDTGLGRDGYSIVSQGKIADMISSKGSERREMFEEAAGISHYRYSRTDALRKLDQAEENLIRLRDILTELEERVGPLKEQSEKAKKFLVLADAKKNLAIGLGLHTIDKTREELRKHEDALSLAAAQYQKVENTLAEIAEKAEKAIERAQEITAEIEQTREEAASLDEQAANVDGQAAVLESSSGRNNERIGRIGDDRRDAGRDREELQKEIETNLKLINQLE